MYQPTSAEIRDAIPHVRYEIVSFLGVPDYNRADFHLEESVQFRRMAHARTLIDFFGKKARTNNPRDDDVLATDYGFQFSPPVADAEAEYVRERINKHLMHLTFSRVRLPAGEKQWPTERIFSPVRSVCEKFVDHMLSSGEIDWPPGERERWQELRRAFSSKVVTVEATANVACPSDHTIQIAHIRAT